jgi:hypothetical protein
MTKSEKIQELREYIAAVKSDVTISTRDTNKLVNLNLKWIKELENSND